ncbi:hypothetical protein IDH44_21910 [Paenibacillus sp. IB182496]|uniref:Uncharacterized protein n=1 Tax=Paenibacillus sabuli TaxID=2772509 RepID=A0A927GTI4_9BACL|nr:hypothetical protein [Paenibacillus sabuli]MBD2847859.1 hypothetical protein [Paenibacillus sabuli]
MGMLYEVITRHEWTADTEQDSQEQRVVAGAAARAKLLELCRLEADRKLREYEVAAGRLRV